jgi:transcriptional regulator of arginine metabolism
MDQKSQRLSTIKKIIASEKIGSQEALLARLAEEGFKLTQATVSRDLKSLQIGKKPDPEKGSIFFLSEKDDSLRIDGQIDNRLLQAGIKSIHFANQFGVVKTIPGYASSIAIFIDNAGRYEIIATIAGDDSILLIPNQNIKHEQIKKALQIIFPDLNEKIFKQ